MSLRKFSVGRMNCSFRWRQSEDQPPVANIDRAKSEHVRKECAVGFRILAVEEDVRAENHAGQYIALDDGLCLVPAFAFTKRDTIAISPPIAETSF